MGSFKSINFVRAASTESGVPYKRISNSHLTTTMKGEQADKTMMELALLRGYSQPQSRSETITPDNTVKTHAPP